MMEGGFSIWQNGIKVAGGSGPYEDMKREADRYAAQYANEGPLKVYIWKNRSKK